MKLKLLASALAFSALATAQGAQAQQACVEPADLTDGITYAVPLAFDAAMRNCGGEYSATGFMRTGGAAFADRFRVKQNEAWPGALRLIKTFMSSGQGDSDAAMNAMIASLPEESLRPFVDGLVTEMIGQEITADACEKIERGMALLAPLPAENVAGLVTFVAELAELDDPQICGVTPKVRTETTAR